MMKLIAFSSPALLRNDESINGCTICSMRFLTDPNLAIMNAAFWGLMRMIILTSTSSWKPSIEVTRSCENLKNSVALSLANSS